MFKTLVVLVTSIALTSTFAGAADMTHDQIRAGYKKHAIMAQFHRWYMIYERPEYGMANQLDILDEDVQVKSALGEAKGHAEYTARVKQLPQAWKNAHHLNAVEIELAADGTATLRAELTYLNQGIMKDGAVRQAELTYTTTLKPSSTVLPKFTTIEIAQNSEGTAETFIDAYPQNRMKSLVHYWLALIEDPSRNPDPAREILTEDFSLAFSSGAISDFDGFKTWLAGPGSSVAASTHEIVDFVVNETGANQYQLTMTFDWSGILPDGKELIAKTKHTWQVVDKPSERFARIKNVKVEVLEPFRPKQ